jgi:hypothetical protein
MFNMQHLCAIMPRLQASVSTACTRLEKICKNCDASEVVFESAGLLKPKVACYSFLCSPSLVLVLKHDSIFSCSGWNRSSPIWSE